MSCPLYKTRDLLLFIFIGSLLAACAENKTTESVQITSQVTKPAVFERIDIKELTVEVTVNEDETFSSSAGAQSDGTWSIPIKVNFGESNSISVRWSIQHLSQQVILAEQFETILVNEGDTSTAITSELITTGQRRFDIDQDGESNLQEVIAGTDPVSPVEGYIVPEMIDIPAQSFLMGSPDTETDRGRDEQLHQVSLGAYRIGKYEVTFAEYALWVRDINFQIPGAGAPFGKALYPAASLTWIRATEYAAWLKEKTGRNFRLPTEAEWELAARGGRSEAFSTGSHITTADANFDGTHRYNNLSTGDTRYGHTVMTGSYPANGYGLHDVHGNASEWTCSQYQRDYDGFELVCTTDASVSVVTRSGTWWSDAGGVRSAYRREEETDYTGNGLGFRLAEDL